MREIPGMKDSFREASVVYLVSFGVKNEKHSRPMTNFNKDPYSKIWFPTYKDTQKVNDIKKNEKVLIILPDSNKDQFYQIEGKAEFEDPEVTREKWRWWYLYWHPEMRDRFWFNPQVGEENRMIINVHPVKASILTKSEVEYISQGYKSIIPE